jgi:GTP-binding protein YchF
LSHIREVDAIVHVIRCFDDENITHVAGSVDPARDVEIINTELLLKDIETMQRRVERTQKLVKTGDKKVKDELALFERLADHLNEGLSARAFEVRKEDEAVVRSLFLLTRKPLLYAANVAEDDLPNGNAYVDALRGIAVTEGSEVIVVSAELEAQVIELDEAERKEFLQDLGVEETGLSRLVRAAYALLGLITYFTSGPKETRAWTIKRGTKAPQAAGTIHTDFERGFIRAETIKYADLDTRGSEASVREAGLMRSEGKEYVVEDGDVILFRFNV